MKYLLIIAILFPVVTHAQSDLRFEKSKTYELVKTFEDDGVITKIDLENTEVQINSLYWYGFEYDVKKLFVELLSCYRAHKEYKRTMMTIDIVDYRSGKKLAYYSLWSGVNIETD